MQPVLVEACHVATETMSRETLEPLEVFWVGFKRKRWTGLQESVGRGDQAQGGRHGPSVGLLIKAWLWWGRRLGTSQAPRPSLPKRVRHILRLSSKAGRALPLGFWKRPPGCPGGHGPCPRLSPLLPTSRPLRRRATVTHTKLPSCPHTVSNSRGQGGQQPRCGHR